MLDNHKKALVAMSGDREICILPEMLNRHGLITGATGTGKTVSLQTLAETFSALGIPVFMADVKGDLSGIGAPGEKNGKIGKRVEDLKLGDKGWSPRAFPVCLWDVFGKKGHPVRATASELGPVLLARILGLNDVQTGVLQIIFRIADDKGLLLLDLKDLRSMALHVGESRDEYKAAYGQISPASIGAIQRALLRLEEEGGELFFGEPALDIMDLLQTVDGKGIVNILDAATLINSPRLYATLLLWLLSEFYEKLPESGDLKKPRLVFFFDEAHLLFDDIEPVLLQKIEQIVRLIRSRGVGIFFVSQNPADMPDSVLGQLGNRIQHALRAFTPKDQKSVRAAALAFRPNPDFSTEEAISQLAVGEALVSFLDENGAPSVVEKAFVVPPQSHIGPLTAEQEKCLLGKSLVAGVYDKSVDRESAYEILAARAQALKQEQESIERQKLLEAQRKSQEREMKKSARESAKNPANPLEDILGSTLGHATRSLGSTVGREIGKSLLRGILGGLLGKR